MMDTCIAMEEELHRTNLQMWHSECSDGNYACI